MKTVLLTLAMLLLAVGVSTVASAQEITGCATGGPCAIPTPRCVRDGPPCSFPGPIDAVPDCVMAPCP